MAILASTSNYLFDAQMESTLNAVAFPTIGDGNNVYIGLINNSSIVASDLYTGWNGKEVTTSGTAYARVAYHRTTDGWTQPAIDATVQQWSNTAEITFAQPTADWGTIYAVMVNVTSTGTLYSDLLFIAALTTDKPVSATDGAPKILANQLKITRAEC